MFHRFKFEAPFYPELSRVPVHVRMKLDLTGVKISLTEWLAFSLEERKALCHLPVEAEDEREVFVSYLDYLSCKYCDRPAAKTLPLASAVWDTPQSVPQAVAQKSSAASEPVSAQEWMSWASFQRYALYKTAVSKNEPEAFISLLDELRGSAL